MYTVLKEWSSSGLACMVIQTEMGHLCGYVGVEDQHPWFKKEYSQCLKGCELVPYEVSQLPRQSLEEAIKWNDIMNKRRGGYWPCTYAEHHPLIEGVINVHGGVTFTGKYNEGGESIWWIGFDCSHAGDYNPGIALSLMKAGHYDYILNDDTFKDMEYVTKEVEQMAKQIKENE